jgi:hypothetical protein
MPYRRDDKASRWVEALTWREAKTAAAGKRGFQRTSLIEGQRAHGKIMVALSVEGGLRRRVCCHAPIQSARKTTEYSIRVHAVAKAAARGTVARPLWTEGK